MKHVLKNGIKGADADYIDAKYEDTRQLTITFNKLDINGVKHGDQRRTYHCSQKWRLCSVSVYAAGKIGGSSQIGDPQRFTPIGF